MPSPPSSPAIRPSTGARHPVLASDAASAARKPSLPRIGLQHLQRLPLTSIAQIRGFIDSGEAAACALPLHRLRRSPHCRRLLRLNPQKGSSSDHPLVAESPSASPPSDPPPAFAFSDRILVSGESATSIVASSVSIESFRHSERHPSPLAKKTRRNPPLKPSSDDRPFDASARPLCDSHRLPPELLPVSMPASYARAVPVSCAVPLY